MSWDFSFYKPRDDGFPDLFLHFEDCWEMNGYSCPNIPAAKKTPPMDFDPMEDGVLAELNTMIQL